MTRTSATSYSIRAKKPTRPTMLYLKAQTATEASNRLSRKVVTAEIASIIDDPAESANEPLAWYVNPVDSSSAVVCHLLSSHAFYLTANIAVRSTGKIKASAESRILLTYAPRR